MVLKMGLEPIVIFSVRLAISMLQALSNIQVDYKSGHKISI